MGDLGSRITLLLEELGRINGYLYTIVHPNLIVA